jgi:hypothetical protein
MPPPDLRATRRAVVAGGLGVTALALTGCGIRLEDDAPNIPFVPTREPIPAETALLALLRDCHRLEELSRATPGKVAASLVALHTRQSEVLHDALRARGVPERLLTESSGSATPGASPAPSSAPATSPSPSASPTPATTSAALAAAELTTVTDSRALQEAARDLVPTLSSLLAQRIAAATQLTGVRPARAADPASAPSASTSGSPAATPSRGPGAAATPTPPPGLAEILSAVRAAAYRLEVAAAQSADTARKAQLAALARLEEVTREIVAALGDSAPPPRLGEPLPFPVTTPAAAARLVTTTMTELRASFGSALTGLTAYDPALTLTTVPWWLGEVEALGRGFGVPPAAFPGLQ